MTFNKQIVVYRLAARAIAYKTSEQRLSWAVKTDFALNNLLCRPDCTVTVYKNSMLLDFIIQIRCLSSNYAFLVCILVDNKIKEE